MGDKKAFRFKQFSVTHGDSTMKVGTDSVLLGAWVAINPSKKILDIGTGSGVIALMLAQRTHDDVMIDAVEISSKDALIAKANVESSPWLNRIAIHNTSIQLFEPGYTYDHIISNPPFFSKSYVPPDKDRSVARHTGLLTHEVLIENAKRLLKPTGSFSLILPTQEANEFLRTAEFKELYCWKKTQVFSKASKPMERMLISLSPIKKEFLDTNMVMHLEDGSFSKDYRDLTCDFYLNF